MWKGTVLVLLLMAPGCRPAPAAANPSAPASCPAQEPTVSAACATPAGAYCSFPRPGGSERVCYCEQDRWGCYDKAAAEAAVTD